MKVDTANRAFLALVAVALAPYLALGLFGCGLLSYLTYRVAADGPGVLTADADLRPAAVFFTVVSIGTILAVRSFWRQQLATRCLAEHVRVNRVPLTAAVAAAGERAGLVGRLDLVDSAEPWSFTYGLHHPRVALSAELATSVDGTELDAVLAHERYHVRNLDPLKVVVARALPAAFFFLPALGHLRVRYLAARELAADQRAVRATGPRPLAAALYRAVAGPAWPELTTAAAIGGDDLLDIRLTQLETGEEPALGRVPRPALGITIVGLGLLLAALVTTVIAAGGPGALMEMNGDGMGGGSSALSALGALACGVGWLVGGVALWRRFGPRASIDT